MRWLASPTFAPGHSVKNKKPYIYSKELQSSWNLYFRTKLSLLLPMIKQLQEEAKQTVAKGGLFHKYPIWIRTIQQVWVRVGVRASITRSDSPHLCDIGLCEQFTPVTSKILKHSIIVMGWGCKEATCPAVEIYLMGRHGNANWCCSGSVCGGGLGGGGVAPNSMNQMSACSTPFESESCL